jgi:hypothetical protein
VLHWQFRTFVELHKKHQYTRAKNSESDLSSRTDNPYSSLLYPLELESYPLDLESFHPWTRSASTNLSSTSASIFFFCHKHTIIFLDNHIDQHIASFLASFRFRQASNNEMFDEQRTMWSFALCALFESCSPNQYVLLKCYSWLAESAWSIK